MNEPIASHPNANELTDEEFERIYGPWGALDPGETAELLAGFEHPWWIGSGWAVELHSGVSRPHHDLDLIVLRRDFEALRAHLSDYDWVLAHAGVLTPLGRSEPLPDDREQLWVRRSPGEKWLLDVLPTRTDGDTWLFKRNHDIRLPFADIGLRTAAGIPYLRPEIVLLFKAGNNRPQDVADREVLLPLLDEPARRWLADGLRATHPGHEWLARIEA